MPVKGSSVKNEPKNRVDDKDFSNAPGCAAMTPRRVSSSLMGCMVLPTSSRLIQITVAYTPEPATVRE